MTQRTITAPMTISIHDDEKVFPSLYEEAATLDDPRTCITRIGRSVTNPFVFYLFSNHPGLPNGSFVATLNVTDAITKTFDEFPVSPVSLPTYAEDAGQ